MGNCEATEQVLDREEERIRAEIKQRVAELHRCRKAREQFIPGVTPIAYGGRIYDENDMQALVESALDFWLTAGRFSEKFEREFANKFGIRHCLLVNSGSSANLLAFMALTSPKWGERRILPGDEVVTAAAGFPTTVTPIVQYGAIPVFVDVELGTYVPSPDDIERAISPKTKAIMLAHTLGNPFDLDAVIEIVKKYNLWLIEDNCDASGSTYRGRLTGTFGDAATFSFYPSHHITMGEGGAVITDDPAMASIVRSLRDWGRDCWCRPGRDNSCGRRFETQQGELPSGYDHKYVYSHLGYNLKATDMQAAVGCSQLEKLAHFTEARRTNWAFFRDFFKTHEDFFVLPEPTPNSDPSWFGFMLLVKENAPFSRNQITSFLESRKVQTRLLFGGNLLRQPAFSGIKYRKIGGLPNTDAVMLRGFWLGVYPGIDRAKREYIAEILGEFLEAARQGRVLEA